MNTTGDRKLLGKEYNISGIVGKHGKSTIAQIIHHCYLALEIENNLESAEEFLKKIRSGSYEKNVKDVIIEVSMRAIKEKKASYIDFDKLIFTNTGTSIDLNEKWTMMRPFIALPIGKTAIINIDDEHGIELCAITVAKTITYGLKETADIQARDIKLTLNKTEFDLYYQGNFICKTEIPYFGTYNLYNALAVVAHFTSEGYNPVRIAQLLPSLPHLKGCFDTITTETGITVVVDNGRTSVAIGTVLKSLTSVCQGNIITVFGADKHTTTAERGAIGKNILVHSKQAILTNSNPKVEEPQNIIYDIIKGDIRQNYRICLDREKAIEIALKMAKPKDVVIIFGNIPEEIQSTSEKKNAFCDKITALYLVQKFEI